MPLGPGSRLDAYEIVRLLGAGGMGEVWLATELRLGRQVALKLLPPDLMRDPHRVVRFEQEARSASALNHPNVCTIHALGETADGQHYIAMEYVAGETLRRRLASTRLTLREALDVAIQVTAALTAAHAAGIVHRDIKPDNVIQRPDGFVKVLDFGLAKLGGGGVAEGTDTTQLAIRTEAGAVLGTAAYMSPEQARGREVDGRADVWSVGVMLYEMVTGANPFAGPSSTDVLAAVLQNEPAPLSRFDPEAPAELQRIITKTLRKDRDERYQTIKDLLLDLQALRDSLSAHTTSGSRSSSAPTSEPAPLAPSWRQGRWWFAAAVAATVAVVAVMWSYSRKVPPSGSAGPLTVVPFTTFPGQESAPTFSPDGSQIAFAWSPEGLDDQFDLYVKVVGSEKALRLTMNPAKIITPAWSPDGRQIAFARRSPERSGIFVVPALGGPERKLAAAAFAYFLETGLSWSPDGSVLAYYDDRGFRGRPAIILLNAATLDKRVIDNPSPDCLWSWVPAFSPDGLSLAVACTVSLGVNDLFILPVAGGPGRRAARVEGDFTGMTWTGDGRSIVFGADGNLSRVAATGGAIERLLSGRDAAAPTVSRDGRRLAFMQVLQNHNVWQLRLADATRPDGPPRKVISSSRMQENAVFSPDGRRVAFESNRSGTSEIWISDPDGSNASAVTAFGGPWTGSPDWSPDGRFLVFDSRAGGHCSIYVVGAEGGPVRRVETALADSCVPMWSGDGRAIYFLAAVAGVGQIFKVPASGGEAVPIPHTGRGVSDITREGTHIYYVKDGALWSVPASGEVDASQVAGMPRMAPEFTGMLAPSPSGVYFINPTPPAGVDFLPFAAGRVMRVVDLPGRPAPWTRLTLSRDGTRLLFTQLDGLASDIMLVDNFH